MPKAPDKILLNQLSVQGMNIAIEKELEGASMLGQEILAGGWADETDALRDEMKAACDIYHRAQERYHRFMRQFNGKLAEFIDEHRPAS